MIAFNLERALAGEPVITRDGKEVTQLTKFDLTETSYLIFGILENDVRRWTIEGKYLLGEEDRNDLFMKPEENAIWVNVYKRSDGRLFVDSCSFQSEAAAKIGMGSNYLKTIKIDDKK
jgi:hypothetical protein